jgi:hypothetical protein
MNVVDTVKVDVLKVPGKGGFPHAKVKIRRIHTGDFGAQNIQKIRKFGDIPRGTRILKERSGHISSVHRLTIVDGPPIVLLQLLAAFNGELLKSLKMVIEVLESSLIIIIGGLGAVVHSP